MNDGNQWQPSAANPAEDGHRAEPGDGVRGADEQLPGAPDDSKLGDQASGELKAKKQQLKRTLDEASAVEKRINSERGYWAKMDSVGGTAAPKSRTADGWEGLSAASRRQAAARERVAYAAFHKVSQI